MILTVVLPVLIAAVVAVEQSPQVDLDYAVYEGIANTTLGLNIFKGSPTGSLRWQAPQLPSINRTTVISATTFGAACPQSMRSGQGSSVTPSTIDEDCLFLNVYAPQDASRLPVLVWIHGGGYGVRDGREDLSKLINANNDEFIGVGIQYRLGAFGFLAVDEVFRNGVVNAGLFNQQFALQWIQRQIHHFGGDPSMVTIWGVSAGGGSVMLHNIAYGGTQGTSLFTNSTSSSPYLPQQYNYADWVPSQSYYAFAAQAGCYTPWAYGNVSQTIFACLVSQDTTVLQKASAVVSASGRHGTWAFLPVTDGVFIQSAPSTALNTGKLNGLNHLTSNAAEEGFHFVPQNISTQDDLDDWIALVFPLFTGVDVAKLRYQYPISNFSTSKFATSGISGPTALDSSATASGLQQTANLVYSESTFICPSYWLAESFTSHRDGGYRFQTSTPVALHGLDDMAVFGNRPLPNYGADYIRAMQRIWANFITTSDPSRISILDTFLGLDYWPKYTFSSPQMIHLNQTGGTLEVVNKTLNAALSQVDATWSTGPGRCGTGGDATSKACVIQTIFTSYERARTDTRDVEEEAWNRTRVFAPREEKVDSQTGSFDNWIVLPLPRSREDATADSLPILNLSNQIPLSDRPSCYRILAILVTLYAQVRITSAPYAFAQRDVCLIAHVRLDLISCHWVPGRTDLHFSCCHVPNIPADCLRGEWRQ